jgi:hypothetical protein
MAILPDAAVVDAERRAAWHAGYRPIPLLNYDYWTKFDDSDPDAKAEAFAKSGKAPAGKNWPDLARRDPPQVLAYPAAGHLLNTGILCDGLRPFDVDVDDPNLAAAVYSLIVGELGEAPRRFRANSPRFLLVYAAAEGEPPKVSRTGTAGKIEVLGRGGQFAAFGIHVSGAAMEWRPALWDVPREELIAVTEARVHAVLAKLAPLIGAKPGTSGPLFPGGNGQEPAGGDPEASIERIGTLLDAIPNNEAADWEWWNRVLMAVFRASGGSQAGLQAVIGWSERNLHCGSQSRSVAARQGRTGKPDTCAARWRNYRKHPPELVGVQTLQAMANEARERLVAGFGDVGKGNGTADTGSADTGGGGVPPPPAQPADDKWARAALPPEPPLLPPEPDWPEPIGREAYRGLLGEVVDATVPTTEADRNAILIQHLVVFGNAIGISDKTPYCVIGNNGIHRTNLSFLLVGESAYSRKGTSTSDVTLIYVKVDPVWTKDHVKRGLSSGEGVINAVRDERWGLDKEGQPVRLDEGSKTKNILVLETEFGGALTVLQRQGNILGHVLRDAWDGVPLETLTKNTPLRATGHLVSVIGHTTLVELRAKLLTDDAQNGFANRFLFGLARRERVDPDPPPMPAAVIAGFAARLRTLVQTARARGEIAMSDDARLLWRAVYSMVEQPKPGLYGAVVSRAAAQLRRMAQLYALLDGVAIVEPGHLAAAHAVWRYCDASAAFLFGDRQIDPLANRILDEVRHGAAGVTRTELHAACGNHVTKGALERALAALSRDGLVRREVRSSAGRPVEVWSYVGRRQ